MLPRGGERVDKIRVYIASALFILLTAIKLLFPAQMDTLRRGALRLAVFLIFLLITKYITFTLWLFINHKDEDCYDFD